MSWQNEKTDNRVRIPVEFVTYTGKYVDIMKLSLFITN